jgi:hypothetical protein
MFAYKVSLDILFNTFFSIQLPQENPILHIKRRLWFGLASFNRNQ